MATSKHWILLVVLLWIPEEAAWWIQSFHGASLKGAPEAIGCSKKRWQSFSLSGSSSRNHQNSVDWTLSSSDVIALSPWTIFGCQNGLRLFKEAKDRDSSGKKWDDHSAIMAVGVVDGTSEAIFQTLMSLGPSRSDTLQQLIFGALDAYLQKCSVAIGVYLDPSSRLS